MTSDVKFMGWWSVFKLGARRMPSTGRLLSTLEWFDISSFSFGNVSANLLGERSTY